MPRSNGLFDSFDNLDAISADSLISWLKNPPASIHLEDYLANKILYPLTLPLTDYDMKIDLAILREALRINASSNQFLNTNLRKIIIPKRFLHFIPDLVTLTWAFVDGLFLKRKRDFTQELWTVILSDNIEEIVGSILIPQFGSLRDEMSLNLANKNYKIKAGSLIVVPCSKNKCEIAYEFNTGKILGKKMSTVEVYGGQLGLMIDGRT